MQPELCYKLQKEQYFSSDRLPWGNYGFGIYFDRKWKRQSVAAGSVDLETWPNLRSHGDDINNIVCGRVKLVRHYCLYPIHFWENVLLGFFTVPPLKTRWLLFAEIEGYKTKVRNIRVLQHKDPKEGFRSSSSLTAETGKWVSINSQFRDKRWTIFIFIMQTN